MDLAPDDKPIKTTWMKFKGQPPPPKKPYIMHNEGPIEQKWIKQLQTKLEEAKASWYPEKKDLYKRLHKQEAKDATMRKKTYESHGVLYKQQAETKSTY